MAKNIKVNALASILVRIFNILFPLITGPYLARVLSKESYGQFNVANSIVNLFIPFAAFGIYSYGIRAISRVKNNEEEIRKNFTVLFSINIISSISIGLLYIFYMFSNVDSNLHILYVSLGIQVFTQFVSIEWMNEAFENYGFILFKTLFIRILMLFSILFFVKKADDIVNYALILSITNLINYLISFFYIKRKVKFTRFHFRDILRHIQPLLGMILLTNSNMLYTVLDRAMLSSLNANVEVSYYTFSANIANLITSVVYSIILVSMPRLSYYYGTQDDKNYNKLVNSVSKTFLFFVIPMGFGLACVSNEVMLIYAGTKYIEAGFILRIFSIRIAIWSLDQLLANQILFVKGREKNITSIYFFGGFLNLVFNYILVKMNIILPQYYILTTMCAEILVVLLQIYFIKKKGLFNISSILKNYIKYIGFSSVFFVITYVLNTSMHYDLQLNGMFFIRLISIMLTCSLFYFFSMLFTKDEVFIIAWNNIKNRARVIKYKLKK